VNGGGWFDWDEPAEVEEALLDPEGLGADAYDVPGQRREALVGATEEGRILFVVYAMRGEKGFAL
jgi:hypothetical protein